MNVLKIINNQKTIRLAMKIARSMPKQAGLRFADVVSSLIATYKGAAMVRAVRANQWVISGEKLSSAQLDHVTRTTFHSAGRAIFNFYHSLENPAEVVRMIKIGPGLRKYLDLFMSGDYGAMLVIPHLGNFDMAGQALALQGLNMQVLSLPNPNRGYQLQNEIRHQYGIDVTPMSIASFKAARERLQSGGVVVTGVDRPMNDSNYRPRFFGRPALLPVSYVRLALKVRVPVVVAACLPNEDGTYTLDTTEAIFMRPHSDLHREIIQNAESVLRCAENFIRQAPQHWSMFYPVWPEALQEMP